VLSIFGRPGERLLVRATDQEDAGYGDPHAEAQDEGAP